VVKGFRCIASQTGTLDYAAPIVTDTIRPAKLFAFYAVFHVCVQPGIQSYKGFVRVKQPREGEIAANAAGEAQLPGDGWPRTARLPDSGKNAFVLHRYQPNNRYIRRHATC
jgi:hypothetical protein